MNDEQPAADRSSFTTLRATVNDHCDESGVSPPAPPSPLPRSGAYVIWDNSNIYISAKTVALRREGSPIAAGAVRIDIPNLFALARGSLTVANAVCVGSGASMEGLRPLMEKLGIQVTVLERGETTGREVGVDAALQTHLLRALADAPTPGTMVLLSGDGAGYFRGTGFRADLERALRHGWAVEVLAWAESCNAGLRAWAEASGVFVPLENYYDQVTFIANGRQARPLSLRRRRHARPG